MGEQKKGGIHTETEERTETKRVERVDPSKAQEDTTPDSDLGSLKDAPDKPNEEQEDEDK